jgi:hypothetical protein
VTVEHHWESARYRPHLGKPVFEIVVVPQPIVDVRAGTLRFAEAAKVERVSFDARARQPRRDMPVAGGVLGDAVDQEEVGARRTRGRPAMGAELETVTRAHEALGAAS